MKCKQPKSQPYEQYRPQRRRKFQLMHFTKMHGLGNDFMVVETLTQNINFTTELIQSWADRNTGVGFDQLLVLSPPQTIHANFQYTIYNKDGSEAGQCGNGARAIARFIFDQKLSLTTHNTLMTSTNSMRVCILDSGLAQVAMDPPQFEHDCIPFVHTAASSKSCLPYTLTLLGQDITFYPVSVGNPHAVIFLDNIDTIDTAIAKAMQQHASFPEGVNVGFAQVIDKSCLRLRVFERGVGETQACGSGATAAAIAAIEAKKISGPKVEVNLLGGQLSLFWDGATLEMTGPAIRVFTGRLLIKNPSTTEHHSKHA